MTGALRTLLTTVCLVLPAADAMAQATAGPRVLLDVGGLWAGGGSLGTVDATYITPTGATLTLFSSKQSVTAGAGLMGRLRVRLTPRVALEGSGSWSRPTLRSTITSDVEGADDTAATQTISQFLAGGGLVVSLAPRGRWTPFARGAVSWMRQLAGDQSHYEDGVSVDLGGGVAYAWREKRGHFTPYGLRADAWLGLRTGGLELDRRSRVIAPGFSAALIFKL